MSTVTIRQMRGARILAIVAALAIALIMVLQVPASASTKTNFGGGCAWLSERPSSTTVRAWNNQNCTQGVQAQMRYWQGSSYLSSTSAWAPVGQTASRSVPSGGYGQSGYTRGHRTSISTWRLW